MFRSHHGMCGDCHPGHGEWSNEDQKAYLEKKEKILEIRLEFIRERKKSLDLKKSSPDK